MKQNDNRDNIYADHFDSVESFRFDENVARVFPDMIKRSAPGYITLVSLVGVIAAKLAKPDTAIYDLGCSLGAVSCSILANLQTANCKIIAVDNSEAMVAKCRENLQNHTAKSEVLLADIRDIEIINSSVVALNYTLQFIPVKERPALLRKIADGLIPEGVLILSEKLCADTDEEQELTEKLHTAFKQANGYSDLEIARKRAALEDVLIAETFATHKERLLNAGFSRVYHWFQCLNFHSILAVK